MTSYRGLLLCSAAMLLTFGAASQAATPASDDTAPALATNSYADLLAPIPNATALLAADNLAHAQQAQNAPEATFQLARYHHHHHYRRYHHHHSYFPWGVFVAPPVYYHRRHCYWTWGRPYWNGYRYVRRHIRVCD